METRWSTATKFWVLSAGSILIALALYRLRELIPLLVLSLILAYILNPLVDWITYRVRLGRTLATMLVYLGLLALLLMASASFVPSIVVQARSIDRGVWEGIITRIIARIQEYSSDSYISILGFTFNLAPIYEQIIESLRGIPTSIATVSINFLWSFASGFASTLLGFVLILVLSFYIVKDSGNITRYLRGLIPPLYAGEVTSLAHGINQVWRSFLRGQIILCTVVGFVTGIGLFALGVPNALLLGVLAGLLELIPNVGPVIAAIPAVLLAYFQGSTHLGISPAWFAVVVAILYLVIQQIENTVLVPRIIGSSVNLHPVVVLIGVLAGASVAGILGIFLAAPVLASLRIIGRYAYEKLLDAPRPVVTELERIPPQIATAPTPTRPEQEQKEEQARPPAPGVAVRPNPQSSD